MNKIINYTIRLAISILLITIILIKVKPKILLETLTKVNPIYIIILFLIYLLSLFISSINLWLLFKASKNKISFKRIREVVFASWSLGLFIPGKLSEFTIPFMLKKDKIPIGKSAALAFTDFIITITSILLIAIIGAVFLLKQYLSSIILFILILFILIYLSTNKKLILFIVRKNKKFSLTIESFFKTIKKLKHIKKYIIINFILSIIKQLMAAFSILIIFKSLNYELNFFIILAVNVTIIIISSIPITINGFGLREGSAVILYSLFNIPNQIVLSSYLLITAIGYLIGIFTIFNNKNIKEVMPNIKKLLKDGN